MVGSLLGSSYFVSPAPSPDRRFPAKLRRYRRRVPASKVISKPRVPTMSEATVVDARLDKLEQDNRRLKLTLGALLLALAAVPLIGAVMPQQIPEVITAREFSVVDENGTIRAQMSVAGIFYTDDNQTIRVEMDADGIRYLDENGILRASINAGGIAHVGDNGKVRSSMTDYGVESFDENGTRRGAMTVAGILYGDENGTSRAVMAANGIGYYDENRRLVWRAPER